MMASPVRYVNVYFFRDKVTGIHHVLHVWLEQSMRAFGAAGAVSDPNYGCGAYNAPARVAYSFARRW